MPIAERGGSLPCGTSEPPDRSAWCRFSWPAWSTGPR